MRAKAWAAAGIHHDTTGFEEDIEQTLLHSLPLYLLRRREHKQAATLGDLLTPQDVSGGAKVFHTPAGARSHKSLVDFRSSYFIERGDIVNRMRLRHRGFKLIEIVSERR